MRKALLVASIISLVILNSKALAQDSKRYWMQEFPQSANEQAYLEAHGWSCAKEAMTDYNRYADPTVTRVKCLKTYQQQDETAVRLRQ